MDRHLPCAATLVLLLAAAAAAAPSASLPPADQAAVLAAADSLQAARAVAAADSLLTRALVRARAAGDRAFMVELLVRRGRLLVSSGQAARGGPLLADAVTLAEALGDSLNLARAVRWLSVAEGMAGRSAEAGALYRRLLDIATARGDGLHEGWARVGLGWEALNRGRLDDARAQYARAVDLFTGLGDRDAANWARNSYAIVLQRQGDFPAALALYRELAESARQGGNTMVEAMACNNTGSLLQKLGDPGAAIGLYERARALQLSISQRREAVIPALNIAVCRIDLGQLDDAAALLGELDALCVAEDFPDLRADVLYEQARVRAAQGRLVDAAALHRRAIALPVELPVGSQVRHLTGLARVLAETDSTDAALRVLADGRAALRPRTGGSERLTLDLAWGERLADAGRADEALATLDTVARAAAADGLSGFRISARARGGRLHRDAARPDSALAWLRSAAAAWEQERGVPLDPRWREQRGTYGQLIYPGLADLLLIDPALPDAAHAAVQAFKARTLAEAMLGPGTGGGTIPGADGDGGVLRALQEQALRPGEVFLDFYVGPEQSFLFAATAQARRGVRLPAGPDLELAVGNHVALLRGGGEAPPAAGRRLADLLLTGVIDLLAGADTILWAPDGALHRLPLAALPPAGEAATRGPRTVVRVPSAAALLHRRRQPAPVPDGPVVVVAVAGRTGEGGAPLPGTVDEVKALARAYRPVLTLIDPRPAEVLAFAPGVPGGILHLAAHAATDEQHPWQAGFRLGGDEGGNRLAAAAAAREHLPYRLAVLAGCESVGSRAVAGEGQLGLSTAFLAAGVPTVVATVWPVSDGAAKAFAEAFYGALADGESAAAALGTAQQRLRAAPGTARPAAWAGFVLLGDGDARFALARRARPPLAVWAGVAVVAVAAGVWAGRRRVRAA